MDQLKAIKCFICVAEVGSFSRAADKLHMPVSSVSRQISALESSLKTELIIRSTRKIRLTEVGLLYLDSCQHVADKLASADELVANYQSEPCGTLRISAMTFFGERVLVPLIEELQDTYPKIIVDADFSDQVKDLTLSDVDIAFRGGPMPDKRLMAEKVMENELHVCASPGYLEQFGVPTSVDELEGHKVIYFRGPDGQMPWWIVDQPSEQILDLEAAAITNSFQLMLNNIIAGKGMCLLPMWAIRPYLLNKQLVKVDFDNPPRMIRDQSMGIYLLYLKNRFQLPKVRRSVEFFREKLKATSYS
ncbi:LysR family transcriptional regulator [Aliamphritea ceti]|uniref:LysR family transcriptional regulator n=1 Tax=Aliamphritea ceti TaxID=1524258 RepID=UPI0021C4B323|nr:LysR family transcriptional regulator [Aliamphritea ceti]